MNATQDPRDEGMALRVPPQSQEAEQSVLGGLLLENSAFDRVADVLERFDARGIMWRRWWGDGVHTHPAFGDCPRADLTVTEKVAYRTIGVPFHEKLTSHEIAQVCQAIHG